VSTPLFIRELYENDAARNRAVRDSVNRLLRDTMSGTTAQRPAQPTVGQRYYDTTLSKPIWYSGAAWKDAAGVTV
jgi:hypothetical protein